MRIRAMNVLLLLVPGLLGGCQAVQSLMPERNRTPPPAKADVPDAHWRELAALELQVSDKRRHINRAWSFQYGDGAELLITPHHDIGHGQILFLDSRTMLVEHGAVDPANAVATADRPALDRELAMKLLEQAWPWNPLAAGRMERINLLSVDKAMLVTAGSDEESYIGPWDLTGRLRHAGGTSVQFDLKFRSPQVGNRGRTRTLRLRGRWLSGSRRGFSPNMSVQGWRVYRFVPSTRRSGGITIASFQAQLESVQFATLAEARVYARLRH